jgi:DNA-binding NarL/FixJ family response regulator
MALANQAARSLDGDLAARAHLVAGTAAHLTDRPTRIERHAELAAAAAETPATREGALWVRFLGALDQQAPDLTNRLEDFRSAARGGLKQSLMVGTAELATAEFEGGLEDAVDDARAVLELAKRGGDPIAHTGLLSGYSSALVMTARYEEGLASSETLASIAENYGLDFASPYAQLWTASAHIGLRRFTAAARTLSTLERQLQDGPRRFLLHNLLCQRARLYASVNDVRRALEVLSVDRVDRPLRGCRGEFLGWRALLTATAGDPRKASPTAKDACLASRDLGTKALARAAEAIVALREEQHERAIAHLQVVVETGIWDPVVIAVRAMPTLGDFIARQAQWRSWFQQLLAASGDASIAASLGLKIPRAAKARATLSPRESEVHELLAQGLTNEEIAKLLYISLSTTKVHVKHIYEKLGVRSRLEAARALSSDV